ncbi:MAG: hypothetical protein IIY02_05035, partial [Firmicutes bacterium]|nr:hypothetical protein [Bacillota bacterium]
MKRTNTITVTIQGKEYVFPYGSRLETILESFEKQEIPVVGAFVNGYARALYYIIVIDCEIEWIDLTSNLGRSIYRNSQRLLLLAAHNNVFPQRELYIKHTLGDGTYCESRGEDEFTEEMRLKLKAEIQRLIDEKTAIKQRGIYAEDAKTLYTKRNDPVHLELINVSHKDKFQFYEIDSTVEGFHGMVVSNCAYIPIFDLTAFDRGFIMRAPTADHPNAITNKRSIQRIGTLFLRFDHWAESLKINTIGELNLAIRNGNVSQLIETAETMQMQNIFEIGQDIIQNIDDIRVLLIAGPSSSGKTTFSHKLSMFFKINGIEPVTLATDDYFFGRDKTPLDEDGNYDFESIQCVDLERLNHDIKSLIEGKVTETPIYDFIHGCRSKETRKMVMGKR